jgi:SulP family sulfate permease
MEGAVSDEGNATAKNGEARPGAVFTCASCGHAQALPAQLAGRQAKCPKCGQPGIVAAAPLPEPSIDDVKLDDLVEQPSAAPGGASEASRPASAGQAAQESSLALDAAPTPVTAAGHLRHFFSGSLAVNALAGLVTGGHQLLICAALSMLFLLGAPAAGLGPHALVLTLLPAVLGCVLLALNGRLAVAVGGPDPASALAVFLLVGAVGTGLSGHPAASAATMATTMAATMLAALSLSGMLAGASAVLLSRLGLAESVRFLPAEVMGGMLAGFGLLLVKAWAGLMAASDPALAALAALPVGELGHALAKTAAAWGPAVVFGLAYFVVHMSVRGLIWPILLAALAIGAWNLLPLYSAHLPAQMAEALARQRGLPMLLDLRGSIGLFDPMHLTQIDWLALGAQAELFAAVVAMAILPSLVRTPILESVLERDCDAGEQVRLVGAASMLSGLLGALPSSLSLSSSLGMRALGATAPVAGFVCGLACLGFLLAGAPLLAYVPLFVPLGVLLATGLLMPVSWMLRDARNPLSRKDDQRAAWASCLLVAVCGPVLGVFASLGLGALLSLARAVGGGGVRMVQTGDVFHSNVDRSPAERRHLKECGGQILVLRLQGFLFLGTLYDLLRRISGSMAGRPADAPLRFVLLDFGAVTGLGASAAIGFRRLEALARQNGLVLFLTSVPLELEEHLERLGYRMDDEQGVCRVALNLDYALEHCEDALLSEAGALETRQASLAEMLASTFPEPRLVPALMKCLERVEAPRKFRLIKQGDPPDCLYFLESGRVHVELALPGGKLLRLKKMGPGTVFGEMGIYTSAPRSASVIATERCVAYKLSVERFRVIQEKAPQLAAAVNRFIVALLAERVAEENAKNRAAQL